MRKTFVRMLLMVPVFAALNGAAVAHTVPRPTLHDVSPAERARRDAARGRPFPAHPGTACSSQRGLGRRAEHDSEQEGADRQLGSKPSSSRPSSGVHRSCRSPAITRTRPSPTVTRAVSRWRRRRSTAPDAATGGTSEDAFRVHESDADLGPEWQSHWAVEVQGTFTVSESGNEYTGITVAQILDAAGILSVFGRSRQHRRAHPVRRALTVRHRDRRPRSRRMQRSNQPCGGSVTVEPHVRSALNVSRMAPRRMTSPSTRRTAASTRRSATNVPFLLPRSSMVASSRAILIDACLLETPGQSRRCGDPGHAPVRARPRPGSRVRLTTAGVPLPGPLHRPFAARHGVARLRGEAERALPCRRCPPCSAAARSRALCQRSSGLLARHFFTIRSRLAGVFAWSDEISGGSSVRIAAIMRARLSPPNGFRPVVISKSTMPRANTSVRASAPRPATCSGAM